MPEFIRRMRYSDMAWQVCHASHYFVTNMLCSTNFVTLPSLVVRLVVEVKHPVTNSQHFIFLDTYKCSTPLYFFFLHQQKNSSVHDVDYWLDNSLVWVVLTDLYFCQCLQHMVADVLINVAELREKDARGGATERS